MILAAQTMAADQGAQAGQRTNRRGRDDEDEDDEGGSAEASMGGGMCVLSFSRSCSRHRGRTADPVRTVLSLLQERRPPPGAPPRSRRAPLDRLYVTGSLSSAPCLARPSSSSTSLSTSPIHPSSHPRSPRYPPSLRPVASLFACSYTLSVSLWVCLACVAASSIPFPPWSRLRTPRSSSSPFPAVSETTRRDRLQPVPGARRARARGRSDLQERAASVGSERRPPLVMTRLVSTFGVALGDEVERGLVLALLLLHTHSLSHFQHTQCTASLSPPFAPPRRSRAAPSSPRPRAATSSRPPTSSTRLRATPSRLVRPTSPSARDLDENER